MTRQLEIERILDGFLADGAHQLADHVLDTALDDIKVTRQRRSWWPPRRFSPMNNYLKVAIAATAVVVVAIVGYQFLPSNLGPGGDPSPTPVPTARPLANGPLEPGTYRLDSPARTPVPFTFTVQDGWTADTFYGSLGTGSDQPPAGLIGMGFTSTIVTHVYGDACKGAGTPTPVGPTIDDLVRALVDQVNSDATTPIDLTVGGYPAKRIDMSIPPGLDTGTCDEAGVLIRIWADAAATEYFAIPARYQSTDAVYRVYIVDVEGERVVIRADNGPDASASDIAELDAMIASIRFEP